jgi:hypothetical protein
MELTIAAPEQTKADERTTPSSVCHSVGVSSLFNSALSRISFLPSFLPSTPRHWGFLAPGTAVQAGTVSRLSDGFRVGRWAFKSEDWGDRSDANPRRRIARGCHPGVRSTLPVSAAPIWHRFAELSGGIAKGDRPMLSGDGPIREAEEGLGVGIGAIEALVNRESRLATGSGIAPLGRKRLPFGRWIEEGGQERAPGLGADIAGGFWESGTADWRSELWAGRAEQCQAGPGRRNGADWASMGQSISRECAMAGAAWRSNPRQPSLRTLPGLCLSCGGRGGRRRRDGRPEPQAGPGVCERLVPGGCPRRD